MKRKQKKPLTISIHGPGIDIDATFTDSQLSELITSAVRRATTFTTPPIVERPAKCRSVKPKN